MNSKIIDNLFNLIFSAEGTGSSIREFYEKLQPDIQPFAEQLHIARIDLRVEVEPNVYEIRGRVDSFTNFYNEESGGLDTAMTLEYPVISHTKGTATFFPVKGYVWSDQERLQIAAISKLVNISLSRCNMLRYQEDAPYIDLMTGLINSQGIMRNGKQLEHSVKMSDYAGCFMNLRNFKVLNQQLSQRSANEVMKKFALRLYGMLDPRKELMGRLGGDNFFALVRKAHLEEFMAAAVGISIAVDGEEMVSNVPVGARVGIYLCRENDTVDTILNNASFAFERAKRAKQTVSYFDEDSMRETMHAKQLSMLIPGAIENKEFMPLYQPKVQASNNRLYGCEALCRWIRDGRMISPGDFIPVAETTGLISLIDQYMLECVCQDIRRWLDSGLEPVPVSINFSQQDFIDENLVEKTLETLGRYNVDGKYLEVEITESCFHENYPALEDFIKAMHENGIHVSLDDFGTGYSSLTMFKNLDLDVIKLDKSFFDDLDDKGDTDQVILESITKMISRLHKVSVSEGVETKEQLDFAKHIGTDVIQGFYFDKPLIYEEFTKRLQIRSYEKENHAE